jgi:hypothetical protein
MLFPAFRYRPSVDLRLLSRGVSSRDAASSPKVAASKHGGDITFADGDLGAELT